MLNRQNSAPENQEDDQKPSFVSFAILNGVLAALVLASIVIGTALISYSDDDAEVIVASLFYWIGIFVDLSVVTIGFFAVAKKNTASINLFLSVARWQLVAQIPTVLISVICWIVWITGDWASISIKGGVIEKTKILVSFAIIFGMARIIIFVVIIFSGLNLYGKVKRIDNTSRGRIVGTAQNQGNSAVQV